MLRFLISGPYSAWQVGKPQSGRGSITTILYKDQKLHKQNPISDSGTADTWFYTLRVSNYECNRVDQNTQPFDMEAGSDDS